ncbi:MAG: ParA family protein [Bacilli bacterium]|nr:ParA family protein [Bacilli bacterium]MDD4077322.1 ParA family protein [Bacilli bacterium]MDD4387827.1 ParA family protein [Bacilli bacterium]
MPIVSAFCKKGGVGKTTFIGFMAHCYSSAGKKVLIISVDDQNSIFKVFGVEDKIFNANDNYLEFLLANHKDLGDILIEARENLYLIKTLNSDKLSLKLTLERSQEKILKKILEEYNSYFDYILIDFPPSSSRLSEVLLDLSDVILLVIGLDSLGLGGFFNTIQYFIDNDIDIEGIKYIVPNGYSRNRRAPRISLEKLEKQAKEFTPKAIVLPALQERSVIKNLQSEGISPFDDIKMASSYDQTAKEALLEDLKEIFSHITL